MQNAKFVERFFLTFLHKSPMIHNRNEGFNMYNENQKNAYLNSDLSQQGAKDFKLVASAAEEYELRFGKDLSAFTREETIAFADSFELTNPLTVKTYLNAIRNYQLFAGTPHVSLFNPIRKEEIDIAGAIKKHFYLSFEDVLSDIEKGCPIDEGYSEPAALAIAWLGVSLGNACKLKTEQIDLLNGVLKIEGRTPLSFGKDDPSVLRVLRLYRNTSKSYRVRNFPYEVFAPENNPYFLRTMLPSGAKDKEPKPIGSSTFTSNFYKMAKRAQEKGFNCKYVYSDVQRSGELHRIHLLDQSGVDVFSQLNAKQVCSMIDSKMPYYELTYQYKQYKLAFNL